MGSSSPVCWLGLDEPTATLGPSVSGVDASGISVIMVQVHNFYVFINKKTRMEKVQEWHVSLSKRNHIDASSVRRDVWAAVGCSTCSIGTIGPEGSASIPCRC